MHNNQTPYEAVVVSRTQESPSIFSLGLQFTDQELNKQYSFQPGQFNMLYAFGIGEVPISIVSDPQSSEEFIHTIRTVGRVTRVLEQLKPGDRLGIRGPFGRGWPMQSLQNRDILVVTGGLGCAPSVSIINYIMLRRSQFGRLAIVQGVKHSEDLIWHEHYQQWMQQEDTQVLLAADVAGHGWPWHVGLVTELLPKVELDISQAATMLCGPEMMMHATAKQLLDSNASADQIWLSMERNMQCAIGLCGHCQYGPDFICKDGPVFSYANIQDRLIRRGV
jgi:NAD(P)H-flavin reductase